MVLEEPEVVIMVAMQVVQHLKKKQEQVVHHI